MSVPGYIFVFLSYIPLKYLQGQKGTVFQSSYARRRWLQEDVAETLQTAKTRGNWRKENGEYEKQLKDVNSDPNIT